MRIDLKKISFDVKVDTNVNIVLSEIALNKEKQEEYLVNPKYFTSFRSMFLYLLTGDIKKKFVGRETSSLEEIKEVIDNAREEILCLVNEFNMDDLLKETLEARDKAQEEMKKKSSKSKEK